MIRKASCYCFVRLAITVLILSSCFCIAGCSKRYDNLPAFSALPLGDPQNESVGRFKTTYMAHQIDAYYRGNVNLPIAVATFVDIDNLYTSSTFGRVLSEQLMSELAMLGYQVVELRQSDALQVLSTEGEFGLSRDTKTLRGNYEVGGLIVGTYTVSPIRVYLNARLIDPSTSMVLSVGSVEMEKTSEISKLLRGNSTPQSLERIPVRNLSLNPNMYFFGGMQATSPLAMPASPQSQLEPQAPARQKKVGGVLPLPKLEPTA